MQSIAPSSSMHVGSPSPIGATLRDNGANFCLFSRTASGVELLLFDAVDDLQPAQVMSLDPVANHTYRGIRTPALLTMSVARMPG